MSRSRADGPAPLQSPCALQQETTSDQTSHFIDQPNWHRLPMEFAFGKLEATRDPHNGFVHESAKQTRKLLNRAAAIVHHTQYTAPGAMKPPGDLHWDEWGENPNERGTSEGHIPLLLAADGKGMCPCRAREPRTYPNTRSQSSRHQQRAGAMRSHHWTGHDRPRPSNTSASILG